MKQNVHPLGAFLIALAMLPTTCFAGSVDVRFCPSERLYSYPLDAHDKIKRLLLHSLVIINRGPTPVEVRVVRLELLRQGQVIDTRTLDAGELKSWADSATALQHFASMAPFDFCGILDPSISLAGPKLTRGQALMVLLEPFVFTGRRDSLRVVADGEMAGQHVSAAVPIRDGFAKTRFIFPLKGTWYLTNGPGLYASHWMHVPEEFAFDIEKLGGDGRVFRGNGLHFEDYFAFGADVLAAANGMVIKVANDVPENPDSMQRPGEAEETYTARHLSEEEKHLQTKADWPAGNYVLIDHGNSEYSLYAHLQPGSVKVRPGDHVSAGEKIGSLGSSGNSTDPHLHFQICNRPAVFMCEGIPITFSNVSILEAEGPRPLQIGDIVTTH